MKEHPILFSTPMVQAILEGRKTMTRRVVVHKKLSILLQHSGCFVIFTAINTFHYGKLNFESNSCISKRRLYGWERWESLLQNEVQRLWEKGVRGLVSFNWTSPRKGLFSCFLISREQESNTNYSQANLYGISWDAKDYEYAGEALGRKSTKQFTREFKVGHTSRKLARQDFARTRHERGESPDEQTIKPREGAYYLGSRKGIGFTKAYCSDIGNVTIRYSENLQYEKGMTLWIREAFAEINHPKLKFRYKADHLNPKSVKWKPSIHMPRIASRITLEITNIKVERLQDISEEDAIAEGVGLGFQMNAGWPDYLHINKSGVCTLTQDTAAVSFGTLWEKINGGKSWDSNQWVWAIEFKQIK